MCDANQSSISACVADVAAVGEISGPVAIGAQLEDPLGEPAGRDGRYLVRGQAKDRRQTGQPGASADVHLSGGARPESVAKRAAGEDVGGRRQALLFRRRGPNPPAGTAGRLWPRAPSDRRGESKSAARLSHNASSALAITRISWVNVWTRSRSSSVFIVYLFSLTFSGISGFLPKEPKRIPWKFGLFVRQRRPHRRGNLESAAAR